MSDENRTGNVWRTGGVDEAGAYAALSEVLLADRPLSEVLAEVALLAKRVLPDAPEVSVTLIKGDHAQTAAFTGRLAIHLDERQYDKGFGPRLDAAASGDVLTVVMADPDSPYRDFCQIAQRQGVTHALAAGLPVAAPMAGALNVYSSTGEPFSDHAERIVRTFAKFAGLVVATAGLHRDLSELTVQLKTAVESRAVIDQAKGILMAQNRCTSEEAFRLLVRTSQNQNLKLKLVAEQLVASVASPLEVDQATPPGLR